MEEERLIDLEVGLISLDVGIGVTAALASAFAANLGFLWRHRGAVAAPEVDIMRPLRSAIALFRQKWWAIGYATAAVAWLLHVGALSMAPLTVVQAVLASGFVFLAVLADRVFGFRLGRREWTGIALVAVGLSFLAATGGAGASSRSNFEVAAMIAFEGALIGLGTALLVSRRLGAERSRKGVLLGASAGLLFTVSHVAIKGISGSISLGVGTGPVLEIAFDDPLGLIGPLGALVVLAAIGGFFASARSLQLGEAVPVIAITGITGNASAILGGILVFGDPVGTGALEVIGRVLAFVLVVAAASLIPGPLRTATRG